MALKKIIIYGSCNKNLTSKNLCNILEYHGGASCFSNSNICDHYTDKPKYAVLKTNKIKSLDVKSGVMVFNCCEDESLPNIINTNGLTCLVSSENSNAISKLASLSIPAIAFGMSPKDTITLSSIDHTDAVISVQREITLQSGNTLEPCEFIVNNVDDLNDDEVLMIGSILILFEEYKDGTIEFYKK